MADKPLERAFFLLLDKHNPVVGSIRNIIGVCSCRRNVAEFLDIYEARIKGLVTRKRAGGTRVRTLAGGTTLGGSGAFAESEVAYDYTASEGSKTAILTTGIVTTQSTTTRRKNYAQVSMRFPAFMSVVEISDALGELIPAAKMKDPPTATDIRPEFKLGSRTYAIMTKAAAEGRVDTAAAATAAEITELLGAAGWADLYPGAGA